MTNVVSTYLKYANLQMAAEASLLTGVLAGTVQLKDALTGGNDRSSKFTDALADQFIADGWEVVAHQANTPTGFSGSLFGNKNTGELVLSFRSTEFIDDAVRDNQATNSMEISKYGWAFGQIADMKNWVDGLYASGKIPAGAPLSVTGYSLGGHLATAFNMLYPGAVSATYTFNGAGVGQTLNGASLTTTIAQFDHMRGGEGNDTMWGDAGAVPNTAVAYLQQGLDGLDGEGGNDCLQGEGGADTLFGGGGDVREAIDYFRATNDSEVRSAA